MQRAEPRCHGHQQRTGPDISGAFRGSRSHGCYRRDGGKGYIPKAKGTGTAKGERRKGKGKREKGKDEGRDGAVEASW